MRSHLKLTGLPPQASRPDYEPELCEARGLMKQALTLLDECSLSAAAATLDLAIHQLDREIAEPRSD